MYRILLVEDDEVIAGMVSRHLSNWGYEVRTAEDFHDVLKTFVDFQPQLVLMDISLPVLQRVSLVQRDPKAVKGSDPVFILCLRQYEHCDGSEYGRRRLCLKAV